MGLLHDFRVRAEKSHSGLTLKPETQQSSYIFLLPEFDQYTKIPILLWIFYLIPEQAQKLISPLGIQTN